MFAGQNTRKAPGDRLFGRRQPRSGSRLHVKHVRDHQTACTTCHDPHGVRNATHLINFNLSYVFPQNGILEFRDTGTFRGNCTLSCHGHAHNHTGYPQ